MFGSLHQQQQQQQQQAAELSRVPERNSSKSATPGSEIDVGSLSVAKPPTGV